MRTVRKLFIAAYILTAYMAVVVVIIYPVLGLPLAVCGLALLARKKAGYTAFGTARWATKYDIPHLLQGNGLIVGHIEGKPSKWGGIMALFNRRLSAPEAVRRYMESCKRKPPRDLVRLTEAVHTAVFAPTGAGKGVSCVLPFLLTNPESCVVIDFKGENARITADARRRMGHQVVLIDPLRIATKTPATFNVLDSIDPDDPKSFDQIHAIAEALVVKEPNSDAPHWQEKAEIFITGAITAVLNFLPPEKRSLQSVAAVLANKDELAGAIELLKRSTAHDGLLSLTGHEMAVSKDKELDGILSTANRSLAFLKTPALVESTRATTGFQPSDLAKTTIYLILPVEYLRSHAGLLRLWITALMRNVISRGADHPMPLNVILDEAASLGHFLAVQDMLTIGRGFGIKIMAIYQSMGQLQECWPNGQHQTLLSNTTQVFFAVQDPQTAEYVSNRLGDSTIIVNSGGENDGVSHSGSMSREGMSWSSGRSRSWSQQARKLLKPEEVMQIDPRIAITFTPAVPPMWTRLIRHYEADFQQESRSIGLRKAATDAACLFLTAAMGAAFFTAFLVKGGQ